MTEDRKIVPCGSCQRCCKLHVPLLPEMGDVIENYDWARWYIMDKERGTKVYKGPILWRVPDGPNKGDCIYLTEQGCSIWERAPYTCRTFDCRDLSKMPSAKRRARIESGEIPKEIFERGRELLEQEHHHAPA